MSKFTKLSNNIFRKTNFLKLVTRKTYNPIEIILFRIGLKKNLTIKTKRNVNFRIPSNDEIKNKQWNSYIFFLNVISCLNCSYNLKKNNVDDLLNQFSSLNETITFNGLNFLNDLSSGVLTESIEGNKYLKKLNLNNSNEKVILDIGANIGDSTLFFAKYYKKVYAFEPVPQNYEKMKKNIELNPQYKDKIVTYNNAVSHKKGALKISIAGTESSAYSNGKDYCEVETIKIQDVLNEINNEDKLVLKMDCEGAEFGIVLNDDLSMFDEIIMECHSQITGIKKEIIGNKLLSEGFKVEYTPSEFEEDIDKLSYIYAYKNNE